MIATNGHIASIDREELVDHIVKTVRAEMEAKTSNNKAWIDLGKMVFAIVSCVLAAYLGIQQALVDRPTKEEINPKIENLTDRVQTLSEQVGIIGSKLDDVRDGMKELKKR